MKRFLLFSVAVLILSSCSREDNYGAVSGRKELQLRSSLEAATRGDVQSTQIAEGETVWSWVSDAGKGGVSSPLYNAARLTAGEGGVLLGRNLYFPDEYNAVNIRALHGTFSRPEIVEDATAFPAKFGFAVSGDQTAEEAYVMSDLLYAAKDNVALDDNVTTVNLTFYHLLSKMELTIDASGIKDEIRSVTLDGIAMDGTFTPKDGADLSRRDVRASMIVPGEQTGTLALGTEPGGSNDAVIVPQSIGGKTMTFTLGDGSRLQYVFPEGKKLESGNRYVYIVTLTDGRLSLNSSIEPWEASVADDDAEALPPDFSKVKVGDWFYSDGTFSAFYNPEKTAIGIVFQTDADRIGQAEKDALKAMGTDEPHGLVMSLKNAADGKPVKWCTAETVRDFSALANCDTKEKIGADISGLHNCNAVLDYAGKNNVKLDSLPAFKAVQDYTVPAPDRTTGWFLPSAGQWYDFFVNLGGMPDWSKVYEAGADDYKFMWNVARIDNYFKAAGEGNYDRFVSPSGGYPFMTFWSSSELNGERAYHWYVLGTDSVECWTGYKDTGLNIVRPILAF